MLLAKRLAIGGVCAGLMLFGVAGAASAQSPASDRTGGHDFDFSIGAWRTHIRRLTHPLTGSHTWTQWNGTVVTRSIWDGDGDLEELEAGGPGGHFQGLTLRLYDAKAHKWALYWVNVEDGLVGTRMLGDFAQGRGVFYDRETINGRAVEVRNIYSGATADTYHFEQAFSSDDGKSWETNFIADLTRDARRASVPVARSAGTGDAAQHAFDWQLGRWQVHMTRLIGPLTGTHTWRPLDGSVAVDRVWGGRANLAVIDTRGASDHLQFISLRLYNPKARQWSLNFSTRGSGTLGIPMLGTFKDGRGTFYSGDQLDGKPIRCRFIFSNLTSGPASEEQAFSNDGGRTWEVNWINTAIAAKGASAPQR
jgi:hypothetical protein